MITRILPGLAVASMLFASSAFAQSSVTSTSPGASAQRLSLSNGTAVRAGAATKGSKAVGNNWGWIIGAVGLVAGVTYALVEGDDDDKPASN